MDGQELAGSCSLSHYVEMMHIVVGAGRRGSGLLTHFQRLAKFVDKLSYCIKV